MRTIPVNLTALLFLAFVLCFGCQKPTEREPEQPPPPSPVSNQKEITSFKIAKSINPSLDADVIGVITADSIKLTLPIGSTLGNFIPSIVFTGKSLSPESGATQNFANTVTYTVTAENGTTKQYTVVAKVDVLPATLYITSTSIYTQPSVNPAKLWALDANTGEIKWKYNSTESGGNDHIYLNGIIYCVFGNSILALDTTTKEVKWKFTTSKKIYNAPAIANGRLFFYSEEMHFYCLDINTGSMIWKYTVETTVNYSLHGTSPVVLDGVVYFGSSNGSVYALEATTGTVKWRKTLSQPGRPFLPTTNTIVSEGTLFIGDLYGTMYGLKTIDGSEKWRFKAEDVINSGIKAAGDLIYFGSEDKNLYAVEAQSGELKWKFTSTGKSPVIGPYVSNGLVYIGTSGSGIGTDLFAIDAKTGLLKWKVSNPTTGSSPLVYNNIVYWGLKQSVIAYDAQTGTQLWRTATDNPNDAFAGLSPFVVDKNGVTY